MFNRSNGSYNMQKIAWVVNRVKYSLRCKLEWILTFWTLAETYVEGDSADESRLEFLFWDGLLRSGSLGDLSPPFLSPSISRVLLWPLWSSSIWTISSFVKIGVLALFGVFGSFLSLTLTPVSFYCSDSPFGPLSKCNRLIQTYKIFESGFQVPLFSQLDNLFGTPSTVQTKTHKYS